jgi:phosphohistidine phosphatase
MAARLQLHLLRHADAGDPETWTRPDAERPLSPKGHRQADRLAEFLSDAGVQADVILSSPKVRARETAEPVAEALGHDVTIDDRLAGGLDLEDLEAVLRDAGDPRRAVLVGHDPDFSSMASDAIGAEVAMKKGAIVRIDFDGDVSPGSGRLRWLVSPELLSGG